MHKANQIYMKHHQLLKSRHEIFEYVEKLFRRWDLRAACFGYNATVDRLLLDMDIKHIKIHYIYSTWVNLYFETTQSMPILVD